MNRRGETIATVRSYTLSASHFVATSVLSYRLQIRVVRVYKDNIPPRFGLIQAMSHLGER